MIELKNVSIQAGDFRLKNVSFKIETGEYAVFMGRTGRGKTTILESICGLRRITSGEILVHGVDVSDWMPGDRGIGYVPQDLALFPKMNVDEHLSFALKLRKQPTNKIQKRVSSLADQLAITHLLKRSINDLSGGEKQRVALGRAISFEPNALLLDEPFSALDEQTRQEMHNLLKKITSESGVTTLHVTHSEEEAVALADRRYSLEDGVVIGQNSPKKGIHDMNIKVRFEAQLRQAAGTDIADIDLEESNSISRVFSVVSEQFGKDVSSRLLDQDGNPQKSLLVFVNDQPVAYDCFTEGTLNDGDIVSILPPIAGG